MSGDPQTVVPFPQDVGSAFVEEFLVHPDLPIVASFLLGWVFWSGISYAWRSRFFQLLGRICWNFIWRSSHAQTDSSDIEAQASPAVEKKPQQRQSKLSAIHRVSNEAALTFTLNLCFAFAGFADFCSLLAYNSNGDTACAFTVAWGSMAAQAARLIGLVMLMLELHRRRASSVEFYGLCAAMVIGLSFILAFTATNTGDVILVSPLGVFFCNRTPFVPTSLLSSFWFIVLELYMGGRFLGWDGYKTSFRAMLSDSANVYVARACSLLLLDVLTVVPNAIDTTRLAQFIPLSIGALIVLSVYNHTTRDSFAEPVSKIPMLVPSARIARSPPPLPTPPPVIPPHTPAMGGRSAHAEDGDVLALDTPTAPASQSGIPKERRPVIIVPSSAPPRIGDASVFADYQARQILPFQVQYAEQLERHVHTGPIVGPIRQKRQRPHVQVVIEDLEPPEQSRTRPSIIGSDIVRIPSAATSSSRADKKPWSPRSNTTSSDYTSRGSSDAVTPSTRTPTTVRDSTMSMLTTSRARSLSSGSRTVLSNAMSRQTRKIRSPAEASLKLPWRSAPRSSFASGRTFGGRDELSIVVEGPLEGSSGSGRTSSTPAATIKQMVISRPHSLRSTRPSSPQPLRLGKQLPTVPTNSRPSSSQLLTVPENLGSPMHPPESPSSVRPSSDYVVLTPTLHTSPPPGAHERVQGSGKLRGPRSPPVSSSTPNLRVASGWPSEGQPRREEFQGHARKRSDSCPELPPLDLPSTTLRHVTSTKR
ncbi:hypothetical protein L226DRAFT_452548 [Lentinus tigrinus ALCF2SS1-7]|uniref:Uncharacterized protein n=1 Tax=Lentinus tigrinus ALCF2SS1-6 TaxID=1328759 RepID=A0A5C2T5C0_9APHY|nr:hypothetical protein L227DRAFT_491852 [Lentinus tigrinus ALCF2SS1-6]RPD81108.1 hypothetical protein L226DRAFT_452548 [Lentinus tigrinus ALCF2SS1-7]